MILHSSNDSLYIHNACELADELVELRDLTGAFKYMDTALTKAKDLKNERLIGYVYINIGNTYNYMSDLNRALDAFENSRIHYEKAKYLPGIASVVLDIGNAYYYAGEIKKAYDTYKEALAIQLKCPKDNISMANVLNNVGSACGMLEKYDEAENYLLQVEELNKQDNDLLSLSKTYNNLGSVYQGKKNSKKALDYFKKAFELKLKYGTNVDKADAYKTQATIFMNQKKQNEAIENLNKALIYTDTNVYNSDLKAIYNNLATLYELKKNFEMANYYNWKLKNIHKETFANEL
ncbi:MAG TPA: tetratricopeptide repeat protein, partial [Bacteroidia bacterium]|nr:tetratricopeptide repeat protein [Bacteroidia bacterium]